MTPMERIDRAERVIAADPSAIYAALTDGAALTEWLPPDTMTGRVEGFAARVGVGFRMILGYPSDVADATGRGPGKSSDLEDVVDVTYTVLDEDSTVEWQATFDAGDRAFAGVMTQTWTLTTVDADPPTTRVVIEARGVPEGISAADHQIGLTSSLEQLADWVTG